MQKEFESEQMRPLAKAVTKTLEKVRGLVREQVNFTFGIFKLSLALLALARAQPDQLSGGRGSSARLH